MPQNDNHKPQREDLAGGSIAARKVDPQLTARIPGKLHASVRGGGSGVPHDRTRALKRGYFDNSLRQVQAAKREIYSLLAQLDRRVNKTTCANTAKVKGQPRFWRQRIGRRHKRRDTEVCFLLIAAFVGVTSTLVFSPFSDCGPCVRKNEGCRRV
jgi:hypothetical protein